MQAGYEHRPYRTAAYAARVSAIPLAGKVLCHRQSCQGSVSKDSHQYQEPTWELHQNPTINPIYNLVATTDRAHGVLIMHTSGDMIVPASGQTWVNLLPAIVPLTRLVDTDIV